MKIDSLNFKLFLGFCQKPSEFLCKFIVLCLLFYACFWNTLQLHPLLCPFCSAQRLFYVFLGGTASSRGSSDVSSSKGRKKCIFSRKLTISVWLQIDKDGLPTVHRISDHGIQFLPLSVRNTKPFEGRKPTKSIHKVTQLLFYTFFLSKSEALKEEKLNILGELCSAGGA